MNLPFHLKVAILWQFPMSWAKHTRLDSTSDQIFRNFTRTPTENGSIGNPGESNNPGLLTVGATHHWDDVRAIATYSSRGPTPDGRVKPDIVGAACGADGVV